MPRSTEFTIEAIPERASCTISSIVSFVDLLFTSKIGMLDSRLIWCKTRPGSLDPNSRACGSWTCTEPFYGSLGEVARAVECITFMRPGTSCSSGPEFYWPMHCVVGVLTTFWNGTTPSNRSKPAVINPPLRDQCAGWRPGLHPGCVQDIIISIGIKSMRQWSDNHVPLPGGIPVQQ